MGDLGSQERLHRCARLFLWLPSRIEGLEREWANSQWGKIIPDPGRVGEGPVVVSEISTRERESPRSVV